MLAHWHFMQRICIANPLQFHFTEKKKELNTLANITLPDDIRTKAKSKQNVDNRQTLVITEFINMPTLYVQALSLVNANTTYVFYLKKKN